MAKQLLSSLAVGTTIQLNVSGTPTDFIIVHQGNPDASIYDSSCDGTWLLMKDIYEKRAWSNSVSNYNESDIDSYLNGSFVVLLDSKIQSVIKTVKIPYCQTGSSGTIMSGSNGLSCKVFLLGGYEVGLTTSLFPPDGAKLDYFESDTTTSALNKRIGYLNGTAVEYWLRSPVYKSTGINYIATTGGINAGYWDPSTSRGIRPAFILPSTYDLSGESTESTTSTIYDLTQSIPSKFKTGDILNCPYSGSAVSLTLPKGTYKLECWGAQGGSYNTSYLGGLGGYSVGSLTLADNTTLNLYVGQQPPADTADRSTTPGGWNGGGAGFNRWYSSTYTYGQGGGGASDIRIGGTTLYSRVIVAGGGGGSASNNDSTTKYGGGLTGGCAVSGGGGTQTTGGSASNITAGTFGTGASTTTSGTNYKYGSGGGGGGWYGGGACSTYNDSTNYRTYNGGGSGYVYTSSTASNYPSGCLLTSDYYLTDAQTIAGNTSFPAPGGSSETGHSGNGYIRITVVKTGSGNLFIKSDSTTWKNYKNIFVKTSLPSILPSGYTRLDYIESSGTQYIDTGLTCNKTDNYIYTIDCNLTNNENYGGANGYLQFKANVAGGSRATIEVKYQSYVETISVNSTVNSTTDWSSAYDGADVKIGILKLGDANNVWHSTLTPQSGKVYSVKIKKAGTLVRDFYPCKNSSGTIGLYDSVNDKFYANAGTGTFTAGPETSPWKKAIGVWIKKDSTTWAQVF